MLASMHVSPAEGSFCDEHGSAIKPAIVADYNKPMGYVDNMDRMTNSYSISHWTRKWTKILFFHLLNLMILNRFILLCETVISRLSSYPCAKHAVACCKGSPSSTVHHRLTPCSVNYNISTRGSQLTSLASHLSEENELSCLFCTWEEEKHPHKVQEMQCWSVDPRVLQGIPHEGEIRRDDAG
jgi:hypothetical protein